MFRKSKALILCIIFCFGLLLPFDSKAYGDVYSVLSEQPMTSNLSGYMELLMINDSTGDDMVFVVSWFCQVPSAQTMPYVGLDIRSDGSVYIDPVACEYIAVYYTSADGRTSSTELYDKAPAPAERIYLSNFLSWTIKSVNFYGNVGSFEFDGSSYSGTSGQFVVTYGSETNLLNRLIDIYSELLISNSNDERILIEINKIVNSNASIDSKLSQLLELQEETNSWLEKIFNWLEDSPEQEKEAASNQASQSSNDAQSSIEDKSAGFVDSVNGLASSMSYSGTQCAWTFPELYLPEIPGVMSRTQLISEKPIDFAYWVNQIPSDILLLVRSVLTIALIGFCFKEFYGVIEYVLTMRGGGNSE